MLLRTIGLGFFALASIVASALRVPPQLRSDNLDRRRATRELMKEMPKGATSKGGGTSSHNLPHNNDADNSVDELTKCEKKFVAMQAAFSIYIPRIQADRKKLVLKKGNHPDQQVLQEAIWWRFNELEKTFMLHKHVDLACCPKAMAKEIEKIAEAYCREKWFGSFSIYRNSLLAQIKAMQTAKKRFTEHHVKQYMLQQVSELSPTRGSNLGFCVDQLDEQLEQTQTIINILRTQTMIM